MLENIKVEKKEKKSYPPMPEDIYQVELLEITSEKMATYDTKNLPEEQRKYENNLKFQFTVLDHRELRGRNLWFNFVPTYLYIGKKGKNKLYRVLEALVGHELTQEEEATIDHNFLNALVGKQCRLFIEIKQSASNDGSEFNNIVKLMKADTLLTALTAEEKENAKVKAENKEGNPNYTNSDDIPF